MTCIISAATQNLQSKVRKLRWGEELEVILVAKGLLMLRAQNYHNLLKIQWVMESLTYKESNFFWGTHCIYFRHCGPYWKSIKQQTYSKKEKGKHNYYTLELHKSIHLDYINTMSVVPNNQSQCSISFSRRNPSHKVNDMIREHL